TAVRTPPVRITWTASGELSRLVHCHSLLLLQPEMRFSLLGYSHSDSTTATSWQEKGCTTINGNSISWTAYPYKEARIAASSALIIAACRLVLFLPNTDRRPSS